MGVNLYNAAVLADTPVGFWKMDELSGNAQDSSGNGRHMTGASGSRSYNNPGPFTGSKAIIFPGGAGFTGPAVATSSNVTFTMEMWVQCQIANSSDQCFMQNGTGASGWGIFLGNTSQWRAHSAGLAWLEYSQGIKDSLWRFIQVKREGGVWKYYMQGAAVDADAGNSLPNVPTGTLTIGASPDMQFMASNFAIYDYALSDARLTAHYDAAVATDPQMYPNIVQVI